MEKEIRNTILQLQEGKTILYPTDTVWGLGCDLFNQEAINSIYQIKKREESKTLCILVSDIEMLKEYVLLSESIIPFLSESKPTTIIYADILNVPKNLLAEDGSVAIRITNDQFCQKLIKEFGKPIISTSANISGDLTPHNYSEINETILRDVDYVVNWRKFDTTESFPSQIIKVDGNGEIEIIRK